MLMNSRKLRAVSVLERVSACSRKEGVNVFASQPPRRGDKVPSWDWLRLDPGKSWQGWSAGPMVMVYVHHRGGSRPCRKVMTNGKLSCTGCADKLDLVWRGYLPLWDDAGGRWLCIIGERYYDLACDITFLSRVKVTKLFARGCPIRAEAVPISGPLQPSCIARRGPASIKPFLLRIWKDAELSAWVRSHPVEDPAPAQPRTEKQPATVEVKADPAALEKLKARSRPAASGGKLPGMVGDDVSAIIGHTPGANGKKGGH